jgi:hypothetical protein
MGISKSSANERAKKYEAGITEANARASEANATSEKLRKENLVLQADVLKLRNRMADRNLNAEQGNGVARKISTFAGQVFSVVTLAGEGEHRNLALRLISILQSKSAGWIYDNKNRGILLAGAVGVFIDVAPTAPASTKKTGEVLTSALVVEGLTAAMTTDAGNTVTQQQY